MHGAGSGPQMLGVGGKVGRLKSELFSHLFRMPMFLSFFFLITLRMFVQHLPALLDSMAGLHFSGLLIYSMPGT